MAKRSRRGSSNWLLGKVATLPVFMGIIFRSFLLTFTFLIHSSVSSLGALNVDDSYNMTSLMLNLIYLVVAAFTVFVLARVSVKKLTQEYIRAKDQTVELTKEIRYRSLSHVYIH
jgi:hypothetical protein